MASKGIIIVIQFIYPTWDSDFFGGLHKFYIMLSKKDITLEVPYQFPRNTMALL